MKQRKNSLDVVRKIVSPMQILLACTKIGVHGGILEAISGMNWMVV